MKINKVTIQTSKLNETRHFYNHVLGFQLITSNENQFAIQIGNSLLEFLETKKETNPFYHFAFNIPSNQFQEAKYWAQLKVTLTVEDEMDEVYFKFLDAHSFYFIDPSGNIVEFISRHSVSVQSNDAFSVNSILNISEINVTTTDVMSVGKQLMANGIGVRDGNELTESLNFMGKEGCFLLLGPQNRRWIFSNKRSKCFPVVITIDQKKLIEVDEFGKVDIKHL